MLAEWWTGASLMLLATKLTVNSGPGSIEPVLLNRRIHHQGSHET